MWHQRRRAGHAERYTIARMIREKLDVQLSCTARILYACELVAGMENLAAYEAEPAGRPSIDRHTSEYLKSFIAEKEGCIH